MLTNDVLTKQAMPTQLEILLDRIPRNKIVAAVKGKGWSSIETKTHGFKMSSIW